MTDAEGRYELTQLPAGRYQLKARRGGYVEVAYGQRRPFERGRPVELGESAVLQNIDFALPPGAVVTGRVVDETGEAVAHVSVSLARRRVHRWRQAIGRGERQFHGRPRGVQDLRRAARRLRDRREVRHEGPGLERSRAVRADLLPRDTGRERGATRHRRPWAGGARDHDRARPRGHGHRAGRRPFLRPGLVRPIHIRECSRDRRPAGAWPNGDGHRRWRRIVRDRRAASGRLLRGGAIDRQGRSSRRRRSSSMAPTWPA